ncbi:MAG: glycosyltransferase family 4 protein [Verrucomicrobia bacterium]|nr:glycosyltransferase family 4 protein [Verrucomicrobiota bacterium]
MTLQRIAYVLKIFPKLSETFITGELAELCRRGVELRILSLLPPREELQHELVHRAGLTELTTYDLQKFAPVLHEFRPQLMHAHFATEAADKARALSAECGVPFTFTAHGYDIHRKPPADFHERALAAQAVVTVSHANADYISTTFNVPAGHLRVIPCGVDTETFRPAKTPVDGGAPPWIVCVARHVRVKNISLLLEACAELRRRGLNFRCALIGGGPLYEELKAKRADLGLEEIVEMPGAAEQREVLRWWQRAAVGVLTSENEGMPVSLMEAASCGVPVVAPAVGGIPELVLDGETGLLTKPNDLENLVATLERVLRDEQLRTRLGSAARARAEKKFSVKHQVDQLLALWSEILNGGNRA